MNSKIVQKVIRRLVTAKLQTVGLFNNIETAGSCSFRDAAVGEIQEKVVGYYTLCSADINSNTFMGYEFDPDPKIYILNMKWAENSLGNYVGDWETAKYLNSEDINAELAPNLHICSIGYCAKEHKWAGWSHRALCKFGLGDKIFEEGYGNDGTLFTQHGSQVITNMDQAKQAAINFADYVS